MKMKENQVEKKLKEGYSIDMGRVLDNSIAYFKKTVWIGGFAVILSTIFMSIIAGTITATTAIGSDFLGNLEQFSTNPNAIMFTTFGIVLMSVGIITSSIVTPLYAGFLNLNHLAAQNKEINFGDLFIYYKNGKTKDLIIKGLIVAFTVQVVSLCFTLLDLSFVGSIMQYFISTVVLFATPLIIFFDFNYSTALEKSILLILKSFFPILLLMFLGGIFSMLGFVALCIGIFFTLPFLLSMQYAIFGEVFEINEEKTEIDEIGNHDYNS